jgi:hypothetical protein
MMWTVIGLLATGRFLEFFVRSDSQTLALGLETAQWASLVLVLVAATGVSLALRYRLRYRKRSRHLTRRRVARR